MTVVIRLIGLASGEPSELDGRLVERFDPDYAGGLGRVWGTAEPRLALQFRRMADAIALVQSVSKVAPRRADGRPNRPLTAYTVEILPLQDTWHG